MNLKTRDSDKIRIVDNDDNDNEEDDDRTTISYAIMSISTRSKTLQLKDDLAEDILSFERCEFDATGSDLPDEDIRAIVRFSDDRHIRSNLEHRGIEILGNTHWMRKKIEERLLLEKKKRERQFK